MFVNSITSLARHILVKTAGNQRGNDYKPIHINPFKPTPVHADFTPPHPGYYKELLTKVSDEMKIQGKDYGGFTDFHKGSVEVVGPHLKVVGPALKEGFNELGQLNKGELFMIPNIPSQVTVDSRDIFYLIMT